MHVEEVPCVGQPVADVGHGHVVVVGLAGVEVEALQAVVEVPFIIDRIGHIFGAVRVGGERHAHVGQRIVVVRPLDHGKLRVEFLHIAPCRLVHLARSEVAAATEHHFVASLGLGEEEDRLGVFRHAGGRHGLL